MLRLLVLLAIVLLFSPQPALVQFLSQQGPKLVGTGENGSPRQGYSVSLSANGNTAIVGGPNDNTGSIEYIKTGKLRAFAVTTATRLEESPDLPAAAEFVPDYEAVSLFGLGAPKDTPPAIVDRLNKEIVAALADPKMKARFADLGGTARTRASRIRQAARRPNRETGQGDPGGQDQAGLGCPHANIFHKVGAPRRAEGTHLLMVRPRHLVS